MARTNRYCLAETKGEHMPGPLEGVRIVDFMISSEITRNDHNYWDAGHYGVEVATQVSALLAASRAEDFESPLCRVLR